MTRPGRQAWRPRRRGAGRAASAAAARKGGGVELCPSPAFKKLASLLPPYLLWRAGDDLLAHLPDGLSPCPSNQAVASLGAAQNDPIATYEDAGGATEDALAVAGVDEVVVGRGGRGRGGGHGVGRARRRLRRTRATTTKTASARIRTNARKRGIMNEEN